MARSDQDGRAGFLLRWRCVVLYYFIGWPAQKFMLPILIYGFRSF